MVKGFDQKQLREGKAYLTYTSRSRFIIKESQGRRLKQTWRITTLGHSPAGSQAYDWLAFLYTSGPPMDDGAASIQLVIKVLFHTCAKYDLGSSSQRAPGYIKLTVQSDDEIHMLVQRILTAS